MNLRNIKGWTGCLIMTLTIYTAVGQEQQVGQNSSANKELIMTPGNWGEIIAKARKADRYIFVDVSTSWCPPCLQLKKESFKNESVAAFYNEHFINYEIDAEQGAGIQLASHWQVTAYPTLLYFTPAGVMVMRQEGYIDSKKILDLGRKALQRK